MQVNKAARAGAEGLPGAGELALINRWSRKELTAEEVYTFSVRLCDNEVDRDGERFSAAALEALSELFPGKSGVFDHQWSARGQAARIYRAEVVEEPGTVTAAGDGCRWLKGCAYMLRTEGNRELIAAIEGGIQREVSVGCAVERAVCSVCGHDIRDRKQCSHVKGETYGGKLCWAELTGVTDAYEWSFVAVPAQRRAGVVKSMRREGGGMELKEFLREEPAYLEELERLEREAETGRKYLSGLRREVARLCALAEPGLDPGLAARVADKLEEAELTALEKVCRARVEERYPAGPQLGGHGEEPGRADGPFLI